MKTSWTNEEMSKRWSQMSIQKIATMGFEVDEKQVAWLISMRSEWIDSDLQAEDPMNLWPLDEDNYNYTTHIAGFPSITVGVFVSGTHAVMPPNSSPQMIFFIDDSGDGKSNKIYLKTTAKEFFESLAVSE